MKRVVKFGYFQSVPAILVTDEDGELSKAFLVEETSAFAVKQFIAYIARHEYIGTKIKYESPKEEETE